MQVSTVFAYWLLDNPPFRIRYVRHSDVRQAGTLYSLIPYTKQAETGLVIHRQNGSKCLQAMVSECVMFMSHNKYVTYSLLRVDSGRNCKVRKTAASFEWKG